MKYKKILMLGIILLSIFLISIISAQVLYCCEKTMGGGPGGYCIDAPECDTSGDLRAVPTSCEATSYCRLGVCINSKEGTCMPNTPQRVCESGETPGVWDERDKDEIPQCQLGCCLIGEQAAFVTLTRCKSLASKYKLDINYRTDIRDEVECIASARPKVKGACVFEKEFENTCKFTTKKECQEMQTGDSNVVFHEGYLCSANALGTDCAPRGGTTCVEGKDEVYFLDTCGNLANVYDSSKLNTQSYWEKIMAPTCGSGSNAGSKTCGDCDYYSGSTCKKGDANYGNYVCKDLGCKYEANNYQHGETWCAEAKGISESLPGSRYFRMVCYNGEVSVEPCADFRQEVCIQSEIGTFKTAACRVNKWQDCYAQDNEKDCENSDKRDCHWETDTKFCILKDENGECLTVDEDGEKTDSSCVPKYAPGLNFWNGDGDAESICSMASATCVVDYSAGRKEGWKKEDAVVIPNEECMKECVKEKCGIMGEVWAAIRRKILSGQGEKGGAECEETCYKECMPDCVYKDSSEWKFNEKKWGEEMNGMCISLGDCGSSVNYFGADGYYKISDFIARSDEEEDEET